MVLDLAALQTWEVLKPLLLLAQNAIWSQQTDAVLHLVASQRLRKQPRVTPQGLVKGTDGPWKDNTVNQRTVTGTPR